MSCGVFHLRFLLLLLLLIPTVSALNISNTLINITGLNLSINIVPTLYLEELRVGTNYSYFKQVKPSPTSNENITFNVSCCEDTEYTSVLNISYSSVDRKNISSGLDVINASINFAVSNCTISRIEYHSNSESYNQNYTKDTCSNNYFNNLEVNNIETGNNYLSIVYNTTQQESPEEQSPSGGGGTPTITPDCINDSDCDVGYFCNSTNNCFLLSKDCNFNGLCEPDLNETIFTCGLVNYNGTIKQGDCIPKLSEKVLLNTRENFVWWAGFGILILVSGYFLLLRIKPFKKKGDKDAKRKLNNTNKNI